jgi:hypothetical protein
MFTLQSPVRPSSIARSGRISYFGKGGINEMNFAKRAFPFLLLGGFCLSGYTLAQTLQPDAKAFVTQYVAAYNAKDAARLEDLYEPKSRACITGETKDFYDESLAVMWRTPIPSDYKATVSAINEGNLKAIESFGRFPLKPDRELHIDYQQGDDGGTVIVYLVQENGHWLADQPCATDETLKQFHDGAAERKEAEARYKSLADGIQEPLRSQLIGLLRQHKTGDAIERYKGASAQNAQTSMLVINQLALEIGQ